MARLERDRRAGAEPRRGVHEEALRIQRQASPAFDQRHIAACLGYRAKGRTRRGGDNAAGANPQARGVDLRGGD